MDSTNENDKIIMILFKNILIEFICIQVLTECICYYDHHVTYNMTIERFFPVLIIDMSIPTCTKVLFLECSTHVNGKFPILLVAHMSNLSSYNLTNYQYTCILLYLLYAINEKEVIILENRYRRHYTIRALVKYVL